MKIKTLRDTRPYYFDKMVNDYLEEGWQLISLESNKGDKLSTFVAFLKWEETPDVRPEA